MGIVFAPYRKGRAVPLGSARSSQRRSTGGSWIGILAASRMGRHHSTRVRVAPHDTSRASGKSRLDSPRVLSRRATKFRRAEFGCHHHSLENKTTFVPKPRFRRHEVRRGGQWCKEV